MDRKLAFIGLSVAAIMLFAPLGAAQTTTPYGTVSGDARVLEDGAKCFEAVAGSQDTCVVLYGHVFDLLNAVPANVQRPPDGAIDLSKGFTGTPGYEPVWDFNQLDLYSSPGFVEYPPNSNEKPRLHPERGLSFDVQVSKDVPVTGYWYLSADFDEFSPAGVDNAPPGSADDPSVGILPCLEVRMVLQTGRYFGSGDVLAEGSVTKTIVTADPLGANQQDTSAIPATPCPNGDTAVVENGDVIEFEVDLGVANADIPRLQGFVIHVEWFNYAPGEEDNPDKVYTHQWNLHTGTDYVPRVLVPIKNPVEVSKVRPQFFDGKIYIHGVFNSPWGSYDVDHGTIGVEVFDESGAPVAANIEDPILRYSVDHNGHFKPVNATFPWDYKADGVAPGTYTVRVTAQNWQHTGTHVKEGQITIASDVRKSVATDSEGNSLVGDPEAGLGAEESPLGAFAPTLVVLGLLGLASMRRKHL